MEGPDLGWLGTWGLGWQPGFSWAGGGGVDRDGTIRKEEVLVGPNVFKGRKENSHPGPPALTPADISSLPGTVTLEPATVTPSPMQVPEFIHVMLKVPSVWPPYRHSISVPAGSSLEEVLMKAQELGGFM